MRCSVTVSIAAEHTGSFRVMSGVSRVEVSTSLGSTRDSAGSNMTSSKVRPSLPNLSS